MISYVESIKAKGEKTVRPASDMFLTRLLIWTNHLRLLLLISLWVFHFLQTKFYNGLAWHSTRNVKGHSLTDVPFLGGVEALRFHYLDSLCFHYQKKKN